MGPKVDYLIVDTTAFIKNAPLHEISSQIITVQDVVNEITSKRQLRRLVVLPYDLQVKEVFQENIQFIMPSLLSEFFWVRSTILQSCCHCPMTLQMSLIFTQVNLKSIVTDFSKKTGDYPSLSAADIKVMALTYQLEKEKNGADHLKTQPDVKKEVTFAHHLPDDLKSIAGFYFPSKNDGAENESCESEVKEITDKLNSLDCSKDEEEENSNINMDDILVPIKQDRTEKSNADDSGNSSNGENCSSNEEEEEDDDDSGWITPQNVAHKREEILLAENIEPMKVACITSDFAMQNVLKQIGLNVLSSDGRMIQHLRSFILRCYACFKTTSIMTKVFCPNCGNKTLKKVAVSFKEDGTQVIHISVKKRLSARGKRFSLPTPKGGKHANNPILCEDQRVPDQRPSRLARTKNNPLDPDYTAGYSPFVMRDINSRSAMLGIRGSSDIKSLMRRDANNAKKKGRRK